MNEIKSLLFSSHALRNWPLVGPLSKMRQLRVYIIFIVVSALVSARLNQHVNIGAGNQVRGKIPNFFVVPLHVLFAPYITSYCLAIICPPMSRATFPSRTTVGLDPTTRSPQLSYPPRTQSVDLLAWDHMIRFHIPIRTHLPHRLPPAKTNRLALVFCISHAVFYHSI